MARIIITISLLVLFSFIKYVVNYDGDLSAETTMLTGIMLLSSYLLAISLKDIKLPKLSGYMLMGIVLGPIGLNFLTHDILDNLKFLENLALSFIAITAGGEFKRERVRKILKSVIYLIVGQSVFVFVGLFILIIFLAEYIPYLARLDSGLLIGFAIMFAGTATAKSPAITIGIITELKSKGKMTDMVLAVTVIKSILLILLFPFMISAAKIFIIEGTVINIGMLSELSVQFMSSIGLGTILGVLTIIYIKYINKEVSLFLLGIAIIIMEISALFNVEILLASLVTGIIVENFSKHGDSLIQGIEGSSLPLYIIFFCFAGADLHLGTLKQALLLTTLLVLGRLVFIYAGNYVGALLAGENRNIKNLSWMGFVGQAGIAVGLATIIENTFPGVVGQQLKTILIATVVINELIGPIFFKYILIKSGETQKKG
ncbi:MAG: cation:proton antiporter [Calditrichaceae bacterium]